MKSTLLACCILAATISLAKAQVTNSDFRAQISILLISAREANTTNINKSIANLNASMNNQIAYLESYIKTLQTQDNDPAHKKNKIALQMPRLSPK